VLDGDGEGQPGFTAVSRFWPAALTPLTAVTTPDTVLTLGWEARALTDVPRVDSAELTALVWVCHWPCASLTKADRAVLTFPRSAVSWLTAPDLTLTFFRLSSEVRKAVALAHRSASGDAEAVADAVVALAGALADEVLPLDPHPATSSARPQVMMASFHRAAPCAIRRFISRDASVRHENAPHPSGTIPGPRPSCDCCTLVLHIPLGDDGRRSGIVGAVADDWRVTVTFRDEADVQQAVQSVREHEVEDDVRGRLGHRVALSVDGPVVFLYAGTEDTAREADRVVREVLAQHQLSAGFTLDRWHPLEEDWEDADVPMPDTAEQQAAEHRRLIDAETQQSLAAGQAGWEVRVELPTHHQAVELAERLQAEGRPVIRRWKYLMLGANNEDDASALAEAIGQEVSAKASVHIQAVPFVEFVGGKPESWGVPG
jgi:hypothetical protein